MFVLALAESLHDLGVQLIPLVHGIDNQTFTREAFSVRIQHNGDRAPRANVHATRIDRPNLSPETIFLEFRF